MDVVDLGLIEAVPAARQSYSRYRSLRGKSVSSRRQVDVFRDDGLSDSGSNYSGIEQSSSSDSLRSRSKSVSNYRSAPKPQESPPPMPPLPRGVLAPRSNNFPVPSSLKILDNLKCALFRPDNPPWRSVSVINKPANRHLGSTDGDSSAAAGPQFLEGQADREGDQQQDDRSDNRDDIDAVQVQVQAQVQAVQVPSQEQEPAQEQQQQQQQQQPAQEQQEQPAQEQEQEQEQEQPQKQVQPQLQKPAADIEGTCNIELTEAPCQSAQDSKQPHPKSDEDIDAKGHANHLADEVARLEAETDRILAEQKKLDLARLQAQFVTPPPKPKRQLLEKLVFFSRSKRSAAGGGSQPGTPSSIVSAIFSPAISQSSRDSSIEEPPTPVLPALNMSFIEPGGKGIVPQTDAPVSASNGGERRITVRCFSSTINLPVTADTSPIDILQATADKTTHSLSPETCVILECYSVLGLERRLRRYESVRDVMNSWDRDQQNSLLVTTPDSPDGHQDLDLKSAHRGEEPPQGFSMQMHHSSKPGKWNKRWVTLLENGQIFAAKSPNAKPSDKDSVVLCHMTDFDIYSPRESEMRRNLKPPKKFCYAIKSQQKTVVFANGENFVHFFSTEDAQQATGFYGKVHAWRSWYLVNRIVDLQKKNRVPQIAFDPKSNATRSSNRSIKNGNTNARAAPTAAEQGAEESLMNVNAFRMSQIVITPEEAMARRSASVRSKSSTHRSGTVRTKASAAVGVPKTLKETETEFAAGCLLGNAYEKLKQSDAVSAASKQASGPFTEAPSLLNGGISSSSSDAPDQTKEGKKEPEAMSWFPSAAEHSARIRSQSVHTQPIYQQRRPMTTDMTANAPLTRSERHAAPLLTFSKGFPEPPRFREGPAGSRQAPGQPLINCATGGAAREPRDSAPRKNMSRRGMPASHGGVVQVPPPPPSPQHALPPGSRVRSKSTFTQRHNSSSVDAHPPPTPAASTRRRPHHGEPRGPPQNRPAEPLVNQAR